MKKVKHAVFAAIFAITLGTSFAQQPADSEAELWRNLAASTKAAVSYYAGDSVDNNFGCLLIKKKEDDVHAILFAKRKEMGSKVYSKCLTQDIKKIEKDSICVKRDKMWDDISAMEEAERKNMPSAKRWAFLKAQGAFVRTRSCQPSFAKSNDVMEVCYAD